MEKRADRRCRWSNPDWSLRRFTNQAPSKRLIWTSSQARLARVRKKLEGHHWCSFFLPLSHRAEHSDSAQNPMTGILSNSGILRQLLCIISSAWHLAFAHPDLRARRIGEYPFHPLTAFFCFRTPQNLGLDLSPGERAMLEVILQNAGGQGWSDRAFLSFHSAHDFSATDDFRF